LAVLVNAAQETLVNHKSVVPVRFFIFCIVNVVEVDKFDIKRTGNAFHCFKNEFGPTPHLPNKKNGSIFMAKFIPTKCQICGADMFLIQPALKKGDTKSVAKGKYLICREEHKFTVLLNPQMKENRPLKR